MRNKQVKTNFTYGISDPRTKNCNRGTTLERSVEIYWVGLKPVLLNRNLALNSDAAPSCIWVVYLINERSKSNKQIQSTLVISNSKGLSEILRDIRTSTYQTCRIEEKRIRLTTFNKYMCNWTLEVRDILKILWKRGENPPLFHNIYLHAFRFSCLGMDQIFTSRCGYSS